jgi:hypothetical protein
MTAKNKSREIIVSAIAKCHHCGNERKIVYIGKKKIQYIPAHTCGNCNKGYHTTYYEDLAKAVKNHAFKLSLGYSILFSTIFSIIFSIVVSYLQSVF